MCIYQNYKKIDSQTKRKVIFVSLWPSMKISVTLRLELTSDFVVCLLWTEWAMKHGLWGHALFLASKMDQRTYASVMTRFANGLTINDPLRLCTS